MSRTRKILLGTLGVLLVVCAYTYTVGGGVKTVKWEIQRRVNLAEAKAHEGRPFLLPKPTGPKDAKVKVAVYVNAHSSCQSDKVKHLAHVMKPYADRIRLSFHDLHSPGSRYALAGYAVGCEMQVLLNGLPEVKVPWTKRPMQLEGPVGENMRPNDYTKLVAWALTDSGQKAIKVQRAKFEVQRARRAKIQAKQLAEAKANAKVWAKVKAKAEKEKAGATTSGAAPGPVSGAKPSQASTTMPAPPAQPANPAPAATPKPALPAAPASGK